MCPLLVDFTIRTQTANTAGTNTILLPQMDQDTSASTALDFCWNNPRIRFNDWSTQTTNGTTDVNFAYQGTFDQLTTDINTATTNDLTYQVPTGNNFRWNLTGNFALSGLGKLKHALNQIFEKVPKDLIKSEEDKLLVKAKEKSEKLLKEWLSPAEYESLKNKGEIELPSKFEEDVIFIVKKDPNTMVDVKKKGQYSHKLCAVAEDFDYPVGDQLLSKIALLKTNEKQFKEVAIKH